MQRLILIVFLLMLSGLSVTSAAAFSLDLNCKSFRPLLEDRQLERPEPPACAASAFGPFLDEYDFQRCRSEMTAYQATANEYQDCLSDESQEAADEYRDAVQKFNQRASQPTY